MTNKQEYDDGYRYGAGSTQDQARGARDAERERQRKDQEFRDQMDTVQRQQEQDQLAREQRQQEQDELARQQRQREIHESKRRSQPNQTANRKSTNTTPRNNSKTTSERSTLQGVFGLIGFFSGAAIGVKLFNDSGVAILICAIFCAWLATVTYKLIIGVAVSAIVIWGLINSDDKKARYHRLAQSLHPQNKASRQPFPPHQ